MFSSTDSWPDFQKLFQSLPNPYADFSKTVFKDMPFTMPGNGMSGMNDMFSGFFDTSRVFMVNNGSQFFNHMNLLKALGEKIYTINSDQDLSTEEKREQLRQELKDFSGKIYATFVNASQIQAIKSIRDYYRSTFGNMFESEKDNLAKFPFFGSQMNQMQDYRDFMLDCNELLDIYADFITIFDGMESKVSSAFVDNLLKEEEPENLTITKVYDFWVDSFESEYTKIMSTAVYRDIYGKLVNKMMEVKSHVQKWIDDWAESLGLLSKKASDTVLGHISSLRKSNRKLKNEMEELREEIRRMGTGKKSEPAKAAEEAPTQKAAAAKPAPKAPARPAAKPAQSAAKGSATSKKK